MQISFMAGLEAIEITMNTAKAEEIVATYRSAVPEGKLLGMGTICNLDDARRAIDAGAMFLVTPNLNLEVIEYAASENTPIIAGALTPTEVYLAWSAGADMVKVFPCGAMGGAKYISALRGPFDQIKLAAVGGVALNNLDEYFNAGATAVGVSTSLFGGIFDGHVIIIRMDK
jgi:2-dehydro-3-deoxyphosphogluconate aldolase/(4S)-4-hydroxy-2-oxoglutarate aldolase